MSGVWCMSGSLLAAGSLAASVLLCIPIGIGVQDSWIESVQKKFPTREVVKLALPDSPPYQLLDLENLQKTVPENVRYRSMMDPDKKKLEMTLSENPRYGVGSIRAELLRIYGTSYSSTVQLSL
jgi:hypothetical protein